MGSGFVFILPMKYFGLYSVMQMCVCVCLSVWDDLLEDFWCLGRVEAVHRSLQQPESKLKVSEALCRRTCCRLLIAGSHCGAITLIILGELMLHS